MTAQTVWITGASGLLGFNLLKEAPPQMRCVALYRNPQYARLLQPWAEALQPLELTSAEALKDLFARHPPSIVIHAAANTQPAACERNPEQAWRENVLATRLLAEGCAGRRLKFLCCSTDLVFDGQKGGYREDDPTHPLGVYAQTKVSAEQEALGVPQALVVRLPLMLGESPSGRRSVDEGLRVALRSSQTVTLFEDEFRTPLHARLVARTLWQLLASGAQGCFHLAGSTRLSRYQLGLKIAQTLGLDTELLRTERLKNFSGLPPRCPDVSLNCEKLYQVLSPLDLSLTASLALLH